MIIEMLLEGEFWQKQPRGYILIDTDAWFREKKGIGNLRKILKIAVKSDRLYGTDTLDSWKAAVQELQDGIRAEAAETHKRSSEHREHLRRLLDEPGVPFEGKRENLKKLDKELAAEQKRFHTKMANLQKQMNRAKAMLTVIEEVSE